jgi:L-fuconolactonase
MPSDAPTGAPTRPSGVARRIDAHHHLWDLSVRPQGWTADFPVIDRSFLFDELAPQVEAEGIGGTVLVQTITVREETPELLLTAARHDQVAGVVGWVDLTRADVADEVAHLRTLPGGDHLVGIRHQVQGEADPAWLARPDVVAGLCGVARAGLAYDLLVLPHQLPAATEAVRAVSEQVPQARFVLDHAGKPPIASGDLEPWAGHVAELASLPNVACKLSGLVTEAAGTWTVQDLVPYAAHVLDVFGPDRVMAGSDWPVCLIRTDYAGVWKANHALLEGLTDTEREAVLGGSATTWYGLA